MSNNTIIEQIAEIQNMGLTLTIHSWADGEVLMNPMTPADKNGVSRSVLNPVSEYGNDFAQVLNRTVERLREWQNSKTGNAA